MRINSKCIPASWLWRGYLLEKLIEHYIYSTIHHRLHVCLRAFLKVLMFGYDLLLGAQKIFYRFHHSLICFKYYLLAYEACTAVNYISSKVRGKYSPLKQAVFNNTYILLSDHLVRKEKEKRIWIIFCHINRVKC